MLDESCRNGQYNCEGSSHSFNTCTIYAQSLKGKWNNIQSGNVGYYLKEKIMIQHPLNYF